MDEEIGVYPGEKCNRQLPGIEERCGGILEAGEKTGDGCSCHINPPCSYCTEGTTFCPVCDWQEENA